MQHAISEEGALIASGFQSSDRLIALIALAGFVGCGLLATQGMVIALQRLTTAGIFLGLILLLILGGWVALNPLILIACFGSIGLLDEMYDFRKLGIAEKLQIK
jgi:hypothetical protein